VIPAAPWRIKAMSVLPMHRLAVTFQDGTEGIADLSSVLDSQDCGIFAPLKDSQFFEQAHLELGVVTWPNGADLDPAWMYERIREEKTWSVPF
jgi:hypothetical protein